MVEEWWSESFHCHTYFPQNNHFPNGHSTILYRYVEDQILTNFFVISTYFFDVISMVEKSMLFPHSFFRCNFNGRKIHVVSTYLFQCNFDGQKIHVVSTYFFWRSFNSRKIYVVSTDFFWCNFSSRNIRGVSTYIFWRNFDAQKIQFVCKYVFLRNFDGQKFDVIFGNL